jgi:hypothetical protein
MTGKPLPEMPSYWRVVQDSRPDQGGLPQRCRQRAMILAQIHGCARCGGAVGDRVHAWRDWRREYRGICEGCKLQLDASPEMRALAQKFLALDGRRAAGKDGGFVSEAGASAHRSRPRSSASPLDRPEILAFSCAHYACCPASYVGKQLCCDQREFPARRLVVPSGDRRCFPRIQLQAELYNLWIVKINCNMAVCESIPDFTDSQHVGVSILRYKA